MNEMTLKNESIKTAKNVKAIFGFFGFISVFVPFIIVLIYISSPDDRDIASIFDKTGASIYFMIIPLFTGIVLITMGNYLYYMLVNNAITAYNTKRMLDNTDVLAD
ncbi:MAG: hypothetical protein K6C35_10205, partial [Eubacterium sp.]|nr:hypothetical protein [Eubacterium sp.]